jgi:site-specific recombinase XerD
MAAPKTFKIYPKRHASGNLGYRVDLGLVGGKRTFKSFKTLEAAERYRLKCDQEEAAKKPLHLADIDAISRHQVLAALERLKGHHATISEAVDFFLKHARPVSVGAKISEVMADFKKVKERANLSTKYIETAWASFFVPFKDHFKDCQITEVTSGGVEKFIYGHKGWNATSRATFIRHLKVLFNFAIKKGYATLNPFSSIQAPKKAANNSRLKVMTVESVIKLLQFAYTKGYKSECAALVLIFFCGVRVDEVDRVTWDQIKLDDEPPVIVLDETKANRRRVNTLPANAVEWLKELHPKDGKGKLTAENYEGRMRYLRKKAKAEYKQNSARISFASYHVAMHEDAAKTSLLLGHQSPALLWNTYRAMVTKSEAERYWKITPDYTGENIRTTEPTSSELKASRAARLSKALA